MSVDKIADPERRLIHLSVARQKGFAAIRIENCYDGELHFANGLPITTKKDVGYHGFGVKSIRTPPPSMAAPRPSPPMTVGLNCASLSHAARSPQPDITAARSILLRAVFYTVVTSVCTWPVTV